MLPRLYRLATGALGPLPMLYLLWRCGRGKEDRARLPERRGLARRTRPPGSLCWLHAASLGEATSVLLLIEQLLCRWPGIEVLVTTGTVTSARLLDQRLPPGARHQFVPVDRPLWVGRFLDHWRPDLAIWVESELWPNLVLATCERHIPMVLVNGRMSARSQSRWQRIPGLIRPMLGAFALCLTQDPAQAARFRLLGAAAAISVGDLKAAAPALPTDPTALAQLKRNIGTRPVWLAASTHSGEEEIVAAAHGAIAGGHAGLLTVIVPRHPARGAGIAAMLRARGLHVARRSLRETIGPDTNIYLADTIGELGLFYRLAGIALIGGSLCRHGGHNPFEAARLDCAILHGPDMSNCAAMARALGIADAAETVTDAAELAASVSRLLAEPRRRAERAAAAAHIAEAGLETLDRVLQRLAPWLDELASGARIEATEAAAATRRAARADARP